MLVEIPDEVHCVIRISTPLYRPVYVVETTRITSVEQYVRLRLIHDGLMYTNRDEAVNQANRMNYWIGR